MICNAHLGSAGCWSPRWPVWFVEGRDAPTASAGVDCSAEQGRATWGQGCSVGSSVCPTLAGWGSGLDTGWPLVSARSLLRVLSWPPRASGVITEAGLAPFGGPLSSSPTQLLADTHPLQSLLPRCASSAPQALAPVRPCCRTKAVPRGTFPESSEYCPSACRSTWCYRK